MPAWHLSSSSDPQALAVVDGRGQFAEHGPHYSRRTPGSKTFTGVGQEVVLVPDCGRAVWACVRQRPPVGDKMVWRNMLFRNLGAGLSSDLIRSAVIATYENWYRRYDTLPGERLRTEIGVRKVQSSNPGFCYLKAGWERGPQRRGILFLYAPPTVFN